MKKFESSNKIEVLTFIATAKPSVWHLYTCQDTDTLEMIYGVKYW